MNVSELLGYKIEDALPLLKSNMINYKIIEVSSKTDKKNVNEIRIVNVKSREGITIIYVANF